jgi:hypothetical protein
MMNHIDNSFIQTLKSERSAFLTRHEKEKLIAPIFHENFGCAVIHVDSIDTDTLGTFTREIPRHGTQREAARKKAELGAKLTNCRFGIGSEGSFIADPWTGMMPWNLEILLLLDTLSGYEIAGIAQGPSMSMHHELEDLEALNKFAAQAGFPSHHLIIRPDDGEQTVIAKGINNKDQLRIAFDDAMSKSTRQQVFVENDLRAHCNPTRQAMIINSAKNLVERLNSHCPLCQHPDFWVSQREGGLPCRDCGKPTRVSKAEIWLCAICNYVESRQLRSESYAEPMQCDFCNP